MANGNSNVRSILAGVATNLTSVHSDLRKQIRRSSKVVIVHERALLRHKKSIVTMKCRKKNIEENLVRLANMQNNLRADTDEKVEVPSWSSSSDIDSDLISSDSEFDWDENQVQNFYQGKVGQ